MRILIVDDEVRVANFISRGLRESGYQVDIAHDASDADQCISQHEYSTILLDWLLPGMSGVELCRKWRKQGLEMPVIMVTARDATRDVVAALNDGADDYIIKPFKFDELLARIRANHRRAASMAVATYFKIDDLVFDTKKREVRRGELEVILSSREIALLEYFLRNVGEVLSRSSISRHVWGVNFDTGTNLVEVYINHLRSKLDCGSRKPLIHTIRGRGYVMRALD